MCYKNMVLMSLIMIGISSGCGQNASIIKQVDIQTEGSGQDAVAVLSTQLQLNGFSLGSFNLPIVDPRNGELLGSLSTAPLGQGLADVSVRVAVGHLVQQGGYGLEPAILPNGTAIPIAAAGNDVWMFKIGSTSRLYLSFLQNETLMGYALTIPQFDSIGSQIPIGLNFFPVIPIRPELDVAAGIFTGTAHSTSGVAVFADLKKGISIPIPSPVKMRMASQSVGGGVAAESMQLQSQVPSQSHQKKLAKKLQRLRNANPHITVQ